MTKLSTTLLRDLPIKQTSITDEDYVVVSSGGTKKLKVKDITKGVEKKAADLEVKTTELRSDLDKIEQEEKYISKPKAIITIESDDALLTDYTVLFPFLQTRGVNCTIAVPPGKLKGRMSWEQIKELVNNYNWSVCSHTVNEIQLATVSSEVVENELRESKKIIEAQGIKCEHLTYPNGSYNDNVLEIAKKYYKSSSTVTKGVNIAPVMSSKLYRASLFSMTYEELKTSVDAAINNNGWLIIYTHGDAFAADIELQKKLNDIIEYAKTTQCTFMNHDEAWEEMGNIIDLGVYGSSSITNNFVVSKRGSSVINGIPTNQIIIKKHSSEDVNSTPDMFDNDKISIINFLSGYNGGFPFSNQGTLITHRGLWQSLTWQLWIPYNANKLFMRHAIDDSTWRTEFEDITPTNYVTYEGDNAYSVDSQATDFKLGKITYTRITNSESTPSKNTGMLCTIRLNSNSGFTYQEFYSGNDVFRRYWSNTSWGKWKKVLFVQNDIEVDVDFGSVEAGEVVQKEISIDGVSTTNNLICNAKYGLPNNVIHTSFIYSNNIVRIRIFNPTSSAIRVGSRTFKITII